MSSSDVSVLNSIRPKESPQMLWSAAEELEVLGSPTALDWAEDCLTASTTTDSQALGFAEKRKNNKK